MTSFLMRAPGVLRHWRWLVCAAVLAGGYLYAAGCLNTAKRMTAELNYINGFTVAAPFKCSPAKKRKWTSNPTSAARAVHTSCLRTGSPSTTKLFCRTRVSLRGAWISTNQGFSRIKFPRLGTGFQGGIISIYLGSFACEKGHGYHVTVRVLRAAEDLKALRPKLIVGDDLGVYSNRFERRPDEVSWAAAVDHPNGGACRVPRPLDCQKEVAPGNGIS